MKGVKKIMVHFITPAVLLILFFLFQISISLSNPAAYSKSPFDILLTCLIIIIVGLLFNSYLYFRKKYFVKNIEKPSFFAWIKYAIFWGLLYIGLGIPSILFLLLFWAFLLFIPVNASFVNAVELLNNFDPPIYLFFVTVGFIVGNMIFIQGITTKITSLDPGENSMDY